MPFIIASIEFAGKSARIVSGGGESIDLPPFHGRFMNAGDVIVLGCEDTVLIERREGTRVSSLLICRASGVGEPVESKPGDEWTLPAKVVGASLRVCLTGDAVRSYFYSGANLYRILGVSNRATLADLRIAWRLRKLEFSGDARGYSLAERAFNILADTKLRACYERMLADECAAPPFPYGGCGLIALDGAIDGGGAFVGTRILGFRPEISTKKVQFFLRSAEFRADRILCVDSKRKLEASIDRNLIPGIDWDRSWNVWKQWLDSRLEVEASFAVGGLRAVALPSRLSVTAPDSLLADVVQAQAFHALLGENAPLIERIRSVARKRLVEHGEVESWLREFSRSEALLPQHVTWRPGYESAFFEALRQRARTCYLFRGEYLFLVGQAIVSEIPAAGHASYVFRKPDCLDAFSEIYCACERQDIRLNRNNLASRLGIIGRVAHGRNLKRWLAEVLKLASE